MPIYNAAIRAVSNLKKDDITEMKGFANPPDAAKAVVKTLCIMFNVGPKKIADPAGGNKKIEDYWENGKKQVLTAELLKNCQNYPKDDMSEQLIETLRPLIEAPEYDDEVLKKASKAAAGLGKWVRAMV
jgi:dynein heavy chain